MKNFTPFLFVILLFVKPAVQFSSGGPISRCENLLPSHRGALPQTTPSPYVIIPKENTVGNGRTLQVEIRSSEADRTFNGFMLQARTTEGVVVGQFQAVEGVNFNFVNCSGLRTTTTNANNNDISSITFEWTAPVEFTGTVRFHGTILESLLIFWVNEVSADVEVVFAEVEDETTTTTLAPPIGEIDVYEGCGVSKTCFGIGPGDCVQNRQCVTFGAVIYRDEKFIFEIRSTTGANYVALALSYDRLMGRDSVIECVREGNNVRAYTSFTSRDDSPRIQNQTIINLVESRLENGIIYCQVEREPLTTVEGLKFDLINEKHFLMLASGTSVSNNAVGFHDINEDTSENAFLLTEFNIATGRSRVMLYIHASFMISAWVGFTSIGIFSARFLKKTFTSTKIFGKDFWFMIHQISMISTWLLTLAGFIIILIDSNRWTTNPHSILGTITFALCLVQPIGAVFRPGPKDLSRPIFNFLHLSAGNFAHLLSVFTMFYATNLVRAELPDAFTFTLIGFVVFYVTFYMSMTILGVFSSASVTEKDVDNIAKTADAKFSAVRKGLFFFFSLAIILFVIALILQTVLDISL